MTRISTFIVAVMAALSLTFVASSPSHAQFPANPAASEHVEVQFVSNVVEAPIGGKVWIALRQSIDDHWHTYWRNPGDSGEPTRIAWELPEGFETSDIYWPAPKRIPVGPLTNFGFEGEVFLLTQLTVPDGLVDGQEIPLKAHVTWLECEEICIPGEARIALTLLATSGTPKPDPVWAEKVDAALAALPQPLPWPASLGALEDQVVLSVQDSDFAQAFSAGRVTEFNFFPYADGLINNSAPQEIRYGSGGVSLTVPQGYKVKNADGAFPSNMLDGLIVLKEDNEGTVIESRFTFSASAAEPLQNAMTTAYVRQSDGSGGGGALGFAQVLLFAFLGGILLNLMPCVLPVLSMKALAFVKKAESHPDAVRAGGIAYTAGVVLSFLAFAGVLIALRAGGEQLGWGFQLQSPVFVGLMAYLIFAVGLNLSGLFEIGNSVASFAGQPKTDDGMGGSFMTGVLAVAVATPCTAPFMATAVGAALTQSAFTALSVFAALGFGLAAPYLLLSFSPGAARALPKPGPWMIRFKQFLAFPMYATAVWLVWVLSQQSGSTGVLFALSGMVLIGFAAWVGTIAQQAEGNKRWFPMTAAVASVIAALLLLQGPASNPSTAMVSESGEAAEGAMAYEKYSPDRLAELRADGRPVFVNFTAAWCITCLANEKVALSRQAVADAFEEKGIAYLKGDWTSRDAVITKALANYGRSGVPLYLLYKPDQNGNAEVLPQVLTEGIVLSALDDL